MNILLVEDEALMVEEVRKIVGALRGPPVVTVASNRDDARRHLADEHFDLVILDLKIPTSPASEDADPSHGLAVFGTAIEKAPGTPIFILTGSSFEDYVEDLLKRAQQIDIWSANHNVGTVALLKKLHFDRFGEKLAPLANAVWDLGQVEIDQGAANLTWPEKRLLRIFAKKFGAAKCVVSRIAGGLSGNAVLRVEALSAQGAVIHHAVAKIGRLDKIRKESGLYDRHVALLAPAATPRKLTILEFGGRENGAVVYGLAQGADAPLFSLVYPESPILTAAVTSLATSLEGWSNAAAQNQYAIRDIRRRMVSDEVRTEIMARFPLAWAEAFEQLPVNARWSCVHGDMHGFNALVSDAGQSVVIDYGDLGEGPASLDPVTLELSASLHPEGPLTQLDWPSAAIAERWWTDDYVNGAPSPTFLRSCRAWANGVAAGRREIAASAYAYLLRQLKYPQSNHERVLRLLEGVRAAVANT